MGRRRITALIEEIHGLYLRQCECATRINATIESEAVRLKASHKPRANSSIPELERFETVFDSQEALRKARQDPQVRFRTKAAMTLNWVAVCVASLAVVQRTGSSLAMAGIALLLGTTLLITENRFLLRPRIQRCLREQLVARGVPICLACGYDLRGQTIPRCSECGTECSPSLLTGISEDQKCPSID